MPTLRNALLAGALTAAAAGVAFAGVASATGNDMHTMNIALPDGAVAKVTYHGAVAPRVTVVPDDAASRVSAADVPGPFAFDGLFAAMEREQAAMMQQAALMQQQALRQMAGVQTASATGAHAGPNFSYSYVSTTSGPRGCTRTVEWRSDGSDKQPQVIHAASGDCDAAGKDAAPVHASAPAPSPPSPSLAAPVKPA